MVLQVPGHRRGEARRPADRDGPASLLAAECLLVGQYPGAGRVQRLEHLVGHPQQERLDVPAGKLVLDHLHRRQLAAACPDPPPRVLGEHLLQRRPVAHRGELPPAEGGLDLVVVVEQATVGNGVLAGEPRHLLGGAFPVEPHGELLAVGKGHLLHRVRLHVAQPVVGDEPQFVVQQRRVDPDHGVAGGAGVDAEPGQQQFLGGRTAAGDAPCVKHQAAVPRLGQVAGGEQAVVSRSGDHDVGAGHCLPHFPLASPPSMQTIADRAAVRQCGRAAGAAGPGGWAGAISRGPG